MLKFVSLKTNRVYKSHSVDEIIDRRSNIEEEDEDGDEEEANDIHDSYFVNFNGSQNGLREGLREGSQKARRSLSLDDLRDHGIDEEDDDEGEDVVGVGKMIVNGNNTCVGSYLFGDDDIADDDDDVYSANMKDSKVLYAVQRIEKKDSASMQKSKSLENLIGSTTARKGGENDFVDTYLKDSRSREDQIDNDIGDGKDFEKRLYSYLTQQDNDQHQQHQQFNHLKLQYNNSNESTSSSNKSSRKSSPDSSMKLDINESFEKYNTINSGSMNAQQYNTLKHMVSMFKPKTNNKQQALLGDEYRVSLSEGVLSYTYIDKYALLRTA